ncbi:MAG: LemA family protein [Proteobacteria bacterium]|nr:LemA family protein [Pseudomonadota bacterium]
MTTVLVLLLLCVLLLAGAVLMWGIGTYTGLVAANRECADAFARLAESLRRRHELIGTLAVIAQDGMPSETAMLAAVAAARDVATAALVAADANWGDVQAMIRFGVAEGQLGGALAVLLAESAAHPWVQFNRNLQQFSGELSVRQNEIALARQAYNAAATRYNDRREAFPASLVAGFGHFAAIPLLAIDPPDNPDPANASAR